MRKEKLLSNKKEIIKEMPWYISDEFTETELKCFSCKQLEMLSMIANSAEERREKCSVFYELSATEVFHKPTQKIAYVTDSGEVREESHEEALSGASSEILKKILENNIKKRTA